MKRFAPLSCVSRAGARRLLGRIGSLGMLLAATAACAGEPPVVLPVQTANGPTAMEWSYWAPRAELAQEHAATTRDGAQALMLRAKGFESYGYWFTRVSGVQPGKYYAFAASHQSDAVPTAGDSVFAVLTWFGGGAQPRELQRDYIDRQDQTGSWVHLTRTVRAPEGAATVRLELGLRRTPGGAVYWREVRFAETPAPAPRVMRVATTRIAAASPATIEANTQLMADMLERLGPENPDIVLLSENLSTRGVRLPVEEKAQTIPGPLTDVLSAKAKKFHAYVITTLLERDGSRFHNTAVLIDRDGRLAGKYRKVHLTIGEMENGLTPGNDYAVFDTDVGRIGVVTCWDNWFSEPMRILRLKGAEVVFMPLAGDGDERHWNAVWAARAMDNGVFLVTSSTVGETQSRILDPTGTIIAEAKDKFAYAVKDLDLNAEWRLRYLSVANGAGEARSLYLRERRPDTYAPLLNPAEIPPAAARPGS